MWQRNLPLLLLGMVFAPLARASSDHPTDLRARLAQRDDFGVKIKLAYKISTPKAIKVEACFSGEVPCDVDESAGFITEGSLCGGFPSGCTVLKMAGAEPWVWAQKTVGVQMRVAGGEWSSPVRFRVDPGVRGTPGMIALETVHHDEL